MDLSNLTPEEITILREMCAIYNHDLHENIRAVKARSPEMVDIQEMYQKRLDISTKLTFKVYGLSE